ncbi:MAG TPA: hydrogenase maturation nickel metallochaperone HypA [Methylococcaceae bacterium]|jgi:hydrogenase nickel incorporation protein HypA/HybF|nr:hydrogenase maturation nickel metallochaperone HypA [Methylococcaceae bacterium]
MHEMSLAEGILQIIEDAARSQEFVRVKTVWLEIGRLSSVEPEALRFCFDAVVRGSCAEGARLDIMPLPGAGWCMDCGQSVELTSLYDPCPKCGGYKVQTTGGTEMRVKELEVE